MKNFLFLLLLILLCACEMAEQGALNALDNATSGGDGEGIGQIMQQLDDLAAEANDGKRVSVVSHRTLQALLPTEAVGYPLADLEGETTGIGSMKISLVSAEYGTRRAGVDIQITDGAALGLMAFSQGAWISTEIDRSSADGSFERTLDYTGYRGYESYDAEAEKAELIVIIGKRFMVSASGRGSTAVQLRAIMDGIDLDKLARLG